MASLQSLYMALQDGEGFSVTTDQKTFTGRGYAVGGTEVPSLVEDNESLSFNKFCLAMTSMASEMLDPDTQVIGGWVDEGKAYIEVSDVVRSKYVALELAKHRNEIAVYDFQAQAEVRNPDFISGVTTTEVKVSRKQTQEA
jgi:phosphoribosylformylglycinamidine (FGAM) synthase PurS component